VRRFATAAGTAALLLLGVLAPAPAAAAPAAVAWGSCADAALARIKAQCAAIAVPLDHGDPAGPTVTIAVSRVAHTVPDDEYQGVVLVNPGGPGGSGLRLAAVGSRVPAGVGAAYDWIGFDPRGIGASTPTLSCDPTYSGYDRPHYVPDTAEVERAWQERARAYAQACGRNGGALLRHLTTADTARDMDAIRAALGVEQINYYGFSYGTYLGQVYATLFPQRVRRMVLDANIDAGAVWYRSNLDQDVAFDRNVKLFFDWVARYDAVYHLGSTGEDVERVYYEQYAKLRAQPAGGVIGSSEWNDVFVQAGYHVFGWRTIAAAFSGWVNRGDSAGLKALYDAAASPQSDNGYAVYLGVQCTDVAWPKDPATWRADNDRAYATAPFMTWGNAWFNAPCLYWPAPASSPVSVNGTAAPGILLVGETLDAATPFPSSLATRARFPRSALVEGVGGTTHGGSLNGNSCVDGAVAAYLGTGELPDRRPGGGSDLRCPPLPQPTPSGVVHAAPVAVRAAGRVGP
jgi:pimeloyl-ACP methyl ester carboxylesterase